MTSHEQKQCPRCNNTFECKSGSIELCQCTRVTLAEFHRECIHYLYGDCLCENCLIALRQKINAGTHEDLNARDLAPH